MTSTSSTLRLKCPAKLNLALAVGPPDDRGFHPICSWMVKINFYDDLDITRLADDAPSAFRIEWAPDAPHPTPIDWPVASDLSCLACQWTEHYTARPLPVAVHLRKRIPTGAGLAGGSADAAATLEALNHLFALQLDLEARTRIAATLGSDVAFFLRGHSAIARGRGEILEPLALDRPLHFTLILPALQCPTAQVYRTFDRLNGSPVLDDRRVCSLARSGAADPAALFNDLAEAACSVQPELADIRRKCAALANSPVHVTGSGAALFVVMKDAAGARSLADQITAELGIQSLAAQTIEDTGAD